MIPEINLELESYIVSGSTRPLRMTVRNVFYQGFLGKLKTIWVWLRYHRDKSFKEYLAFPITYLIGFPDVHAYHSIDAEKELTELLEKQVNTNKSIV